MKLKSSSLITLATLQVLSTILDSIDIQCFHYHRKFCRAALLSVPEPPPVSLKAGLETSLAEDKDDPQGVDP